MTTAPVADQRRLLDIQELDTRLAKLAHQRRSHPTVAALAELTDRAEDLSRARTQAEVTAADARKALSKAETEVDQVRTRAARGTERLNSGQGTPKELQNITSELEALTRRQSVLEDVQLEAMEAVETSTDAAEAINAQLAALQAQIDQTRTEQTSAFADIDAETESVSASRARLADGIDANLMRMYERVRARTGGLGAVALRGEATVGLQVPLSLTEKAAIKAAPADEVLQSEDYDYLLIRIED